MAIIKNNPTFNRYAARGVDNYPLTNFTGSIGTGYHSRTICTYEDTSQANLATADPAEWCTDANGDGIKMLLDNGYGAFHGDAILPGKYWRPGKTIRIKGSLTARAELEQNTGPIYLNLRFGLKEKQNNATTIFAIQNNNNNHIFAQVGLGDPAIVVPYKSITFCQVITCTEINTDNANPIKFSSYGFYEYSYGTEADALTDYLFTYVPIWYSTRFNYAVSADYYNYNTAIIMNGYGTTTGGVALFELYLPAFTIEELA